MSAPPRRIALPVRLRPRRPVASGAHRERGSVLVELTMVVPLLVFLVLGMMEMGGAWRDKQTVTQASRQGARVVSHFGDDGDADRQGLIAALSVLTPAQRAELNFIVIYKANPDGSMPAGCMTGSVNGSCNRYTAAQLTDAKLATTATWTANPKLDNSFQPSTRNVSLTGAGPDHLGVYLSVNRDWVTGFFPGDGTTLTARTVMQLEPEVS